MSGQRNGHSSTQPITTTGSSLSERLARRRPGDTTTLQAGPARSVVVTTPAAPVRAYSAQVVRSGAPSPELPAAATTASVTMSGTITSDPSNQKRPAEETAAESNKRQQSMDEDVQDNKDEKEAEETGLEEAIEGMDIS